MKQLIICQRVAKRFPRLNLFSYHHFTFTRYKATGGALRG